MATDHRLVGESVCAALQSQGFAVTLLAGWPPRPAEMSEMSLGPSKPAATLLVVCDLESPGRIAEVRSAEGWRERLGLSAWLVVDAGEPGTAWGAALDAGARAVIGSGATLPELVRALELVAGGRPALDAVERQGLIRRWRAQRTSPERLRCQLDHLSPQDGELLIMLYRGTTLRSIAERFGVSEAAVRSQVTAMLRRLSEPAAFSARHEE